MAYLGDAFLDDLEDLNNDDSEEDEAEINDVALGGAQQGGVSKKRDHDMMDDLDDLDDDDARASKKLKGKLGDGAAANGGGGGGSSGGASSIDNALEKLTEKNLASIAKLRNSHRYKQLMEEVTAALAREPEPIVGPVEEHDEYQLIVASNELIHSIDEEMMLVHRYIAKIYSSKFPELESLIPQPMDFIQTVMLVKNEMDMTKVQLEGTLPQSTIMVVSVTGSTTAGKPLTEDMLDECMRACDEFMALQAAKGDVLSFVQSRMEHIAPNVTALVGSRIGAQLMALAGGLTAISKVPSCNLQLVGQEKTNLSGFALTAVGRHNGALHMADIVQGAPPYLQGKTLRTLAGRVTLAARCDAYGQDKSGATGQKFRTEIAAKMEKWEDPGKARTKKALPKPDEVVKKRRAGKRVRRQKEKYEVTELAKQANRMAFKNSADEYSDCAMGIDFGMIGKAGSGKLRAPAKKEVKHNVNSKKMKVANIKSSGSTHGLASSMVFTPIQGLELVNPEAESERVREANKKWFDAQSGFASAKPK